MVAQDLLEAAVHGGVDLGRTHLAVLDVQLDFEVTFDAVERADQKTGHAWSS